MVDEGNYTSATWINRQFLEDVLEKEEGQSVSVERLDVREALQKGDNYVGKLYRARVKYHTLNEKGDKTEKGVSLIIKTMSDVKVMIRYATEAGIFPRETKMYAETLPRIHSILDSVFEPGTVRVSGRFLPCDRENTLVLEDLQESGFKMADRQAGFDLDHTLLVVKKLAQLHAASVLLHTRDPEHVQSYKDVFYREEDREGVSKFLGSSFSNLAGIVETWGEEFQEYGDKLRAVGRKGCDYVIAMLKPKKGKLNALGHGDCWANNCMFRYAEDGRPVDIRFVDFQMCRYASPVFDLQYFTYSSVRGQVREQHWDRILREYVFELAGALSVLGAADRIPSLEQMKQEFDAHSQFGLLSACAILPIVLADKEHALELDKLDEDGFETGDASYQEKALNGPRFREAFKRLLPHFVDEGAL